MSLGNANSKILIIPCFNYPLLKMKGVLTIESLIWKEERVFYSNTNTRVQTVGQDIDQIS